MKDKSFIYYANPCTTPLEDPAFQCAEDVKGAAPCVLYNNRQECSGPDYACVRLAGAAMARYVIQFYSEANEDTLAMERDEFAKRAPLPPTAVKYYVDVHGQEVEKVTDPQQVIERVSKYARAALDIRPGERMFRSPEEIWAPPGEKAEEKTPAEA